MNNYSKKHDQALEACNKVINGIEDETLSVSSSLLLCKRIARLVNDSEGQEWLDFEYGGYPTENGIPTYAWNIGVRHGRKYRAFNLDGKSGEYMFTELCGELEAIIESKIKAINNYTTQGYSVSGDNAIAATDHMTKQVIQGTNDLLLSIQTAKRRLSILKSQYYDYAVRWQLELQFGRTAQTVYMEYQEKVDRYYSALPTTTLRKLNAIEELIEDENPEHYAQVITSCRRLWVETAKLLFSEVLPDYHGNVFKTKTGKEIDISGDHDINQLSAVIEILQPKASKNTLVGSEINFLIDWMKQISEAQNTGVHHEVTREMAQRCIIHTYIALGDILSLKAEVDSTGQMK